MGRKKEKPATIVSPAATAEQERLSIVENLIQQGLHAVEEYDYEVARTALTEACELSGGAEAAVRADRKSTRLNSSHSTLSRMPSSA